MNYWTDNTHTRIGKCHLPSRLDLDEELEYEDWQCRVELLAQLWGLWRLLDGAPRRDGRRMVGGLSRGRGGILGQVLLQQAQGLPPVKNKFIFLTCSLNNKKLYSSFEIILNISLKGNLYYNKQWKKKKNEIWTNFCNDYKVLVFKFILV